MNETWKFLSDFLAEGTETAEETADKAAESSKPAGNLNPVDAAKVAAPVKEKAETKSAVPTLPKVDGVSVPGGITAILLFILFIVFAIQPTASGQTRLQLLWSIIAKGGGMRGQAGAGIDNQTPGNGGVYTPIQIPGSYWGADPNKIPGMTPGDVWDPKTGWKNWGPV